MNGRGERKRDVRQLEEGRREGEGGGGGGGGGNASLIWKKGRRE
jgi:hypothetical protein